MIQSFFPRVCAMLAICLIPLAVDAENYDAWSDSAYDFSSVHTVYVDTLDTSSLQTDTPLKVYRLKKRLSKKGGRSERHYSGYACLRTACPFCRTPRSR